MGLMSCGRTCCENILCERLVLESSKYICNECYSELVEYKQIALPKQSTSKEVRKFIEDFMDTKPGTYRVLCNEEVDEEFKRLTCG